MFRPSRTSRYLLGFLILMVMGNEIRAHLGSCEDHSPECGKWESWGFCDTNLKFMAQNCPVSCKICLDPGCFNRSPMCDSWAYDGACARFEEVKRLCPHSCNLCQIPEEFLSNNTKSIARPDFDCGRPLTPGFKRPKRQTNFVADYLLHDAQGRSKRHSGPHAHDHGHDHAHDHDHAHAHDHDHAHERIQAPLQKSPTNFRNTYCAPVLIHQRFLLIGAHCVLNPDRPVRQIRLGSLNPVDYEVLRVIIHPNYKLNSFERYNDIALVETKDPMQFNEEVYPSCISDERPPAGTVVTDNDSVPDHDSREKRALEIIHSLQCEILYKSEGMSESFRTQYPDLIQDTDILCANYQGNKACENHANGPLFHDESGRRFLVGLVSKDISCRRTGAVSSLPGFYTSVADHIDFINNILYP
ncbi:mast cell tryptase-like [Palaemon carinicauda]|uniref:mast cell tryptase-like n=1 Tax=Palaemon carinicauda TaxID=392227 RepID=UPI0035B5E548